MSATASDNRKNEARNQRSSKSAKLEISLCKRVLRNKKRETNLPQMRIEQAPDKMHTTNKVMAHLLFVYFSDDSFAKMLIFFKMVTKKKNKKLCGFFTC